ncbi:hypothetical protein BMD_3078 [Priestia megaterium DSM 319]|uniref:Uncharacterized protein n=1 Tax=Priestia megaterium (strain DSM 319 / IMG 1521) TaxID=592022 RepID=D5DGS7_PRIM3|nr:hypothetical protein BMD_3078 [Priestia megaterium DSM 319]
MNISTRVISALAALFYGRKKYFSRIFFEGTFLLTLTNMRVSNVFRGILCAIFG